MFKCGWKMEQDKVDTILKGLPEPLKDVGSAFMRNNKNIRKTMEIVLDRDLSKKEESRF